jgi:hypothetical protein
MPGDEIRALRTSGGRLNRARGRSRCFSICEIPILFQATLSRPAWGPRYFAGTGGGWTPTTGRGWMSTGATGLDWTTGGD